jgi:hypothetical protein
MDARKNEPQLSAILVAGPLRRRAQRVLDALGAQTAAQAIEAIVVDIAPPGTPRLASPPHLRVVYANHPEIDRWGAARTAGVRLSSSPIVAFIEDHCFPARDWAEILVDVHRGPWQSVGYSFTNANPESFVSRSSFMARYGQFVHPTHGGPAPIVSGNNVSYKRELLLSFGDALPNLLAIDFNLQEILQQRGDPLFVEARALAAHQNYENFAKESKTGHWYCRLLAARRAETQSWSLTRRLIHGVGAPLGSPAIRFARLVASLSGRRSLWWVVAVGTPQILALYLTDALGESFGYLFGAGNAEREALRWELETERTAST